ncbi:hypothetical protein F4821DRAFT_237541 [Hypoxylon rubiginosum]|uniref:Uncharacterized protein n=1 Tax=Hypoxylon rubiginosum TaxID=110542 RepID=A0ACC0D2P5_9PEZI|nr:hypothetical protein F4821DRAFT_237541 [Hypoxylon rubiginosum]
MLANTLKASTALLSLLLLAGPAAAKTDLSGCVSSETVAYGGASLIWYVPDSGEICAFLDCGGGRAPPKTTVPGCAAYSGTATYTPSFLPGFGADATGATTVTGDSSPAETSAVVASSTSTTAAGADVTSAAGNGLSSFVATITAAPSSTTTLETSTTATGSSSGGSSSAGSSQAAVSSSSASASSSVSQAAAMPTAVVKGAVGMVVGLAAGVAML